MKKFSAFLLMIVFMASCGPEHPLEYMTISGKIENNKDSILILRGQKLSKKITINTDGTFKDTLVVKKKGNHQMFLGRQRVIAYFSNGYDLKFTTDADAFNQEIFYEGIGANTNNYINSQYTFQKSFGNPSKFFELSKDAYYKRLDSIEKGIDSILNIYTDVDTTVINESKKLNSRFLTNMRKEKVYESQHKRALEFKALNDKIAKGQPSPEFKNYINYRGGKNSLKDYRGKYVYIDLWATWCKPCIAQFPTLKKLEEEYKNKNITFISIATDDNKTARSWPKAKKLWRDAVKKYKLKGVQLFVGEDNTFVTDYLVGKIPRFIILDPNGVIVDNNAPRPGDPKLKELFKELGI
ncbi:MAG: TlpA family protein disulfide reductase [Flavobacteriaceae bacterium]